MKKMRNNKYLLIFILVFFISTNIVFAKNYKVIDLTIDFDERVWNVFETDSLMDDPNTKKMGWNYDQLMALKHSWEEDDIYLVSILQQNELAIYVRSYKNRNISNLNYQTTEAIEALKEDLKNEYSTEAIIEENINEYKYLVFNYYDDYNYLEYLTVINGKFYDIYLEKRDKINSSDENILKDVVKSITFKKKWYYSIPQREKDYIYIFKRTLFILTIYLLVQKGLDRISSAAKKITSKTN